MALYRLLYRSDIVLSGPDFDDQIDRIVHASARANADAGLSGALFAAGGVFIQALEGPLPALEAKFEQICSDLRHQHVRLIEIAAVEERTFAEWPMVRLSHAPDVTEVTALCRILASRQPMRLDMATSSALVSLMRSVLVTGADGSGTASHPALAGGR
ncbi:MAG: BLUF domain-containing protein [Pseudorhizobium sp.]